MQVCKLCDECSASVGNDANWTSMPASFLFLLHVASLVLILWVGALCLHAQNISYLAAYDCCEPTVEDRDGFYDAAETIYRELIAGVQSSRPFCIQLLRGTEPIDVPAEFLERFRDFGGRLHRGSECEILESGQMGLVRSGQPATLLTLTRMHIDKAKPNAAHGVGGQIYASLGGEGWDFYLRRQQSAWRVVKRVATWEM